MFESRIRLFESQSPLSNVPGLAVVIVGNRADSLSYVGMKEKAFNRLGLVARRVALPEQSSQQQIQQAVRELNSDPLYHGVLVQVMPRYLVLVL